ncbi:MAG: hypothetical protein ACFE8Z_07130 [Candidatus Hermodarchaeota archaeon]
MSLNGKDDNYWIGVRDALRMVDSFLRWSRRHPTEAKSLDDFLAEGLVAAAKRCESCLGKELGLKYGTGDEVIEEEASGDEVDFRTPSEYEEPPPEEPLSYETTPEPEPETMPETADEPEITPVEPSSPEEIMRSILADDSLWGTEEAEFDAEYPVERETEYIGVAEDDSSLEPEEEAPPEVAPTFEKRVWTPYDEPSTLEDELQDDFEEDSVADDESYEELEEEDESEEESVKSGPPPPPPPPESDETEEERRQRARRLFFGT